MKTIKFTDREIEFLYDLYQYELGDTEKYIDNIKSVLVKLRASKAHKDNEPDVKQPAKRGRKPKVVIAESLLAEPFIKVPEAWSDKGVPRKKRINVVVKEVPQLEAAVPSIESKPKPLIPKKKAKKKKKFKYRGVFLTSLRKPLLEKMVEEPAFPETKTSVE